MQLNRNRNPAPPAGGAGPGSLRYGKGLAGGRLLLSDVRTLSLFVNEARYRSLHRMLGLPRDQANLASAIALLALAEATRESAERLHIPGPSFGELAFGSAAFKELILGPPKSGAPPMPMFTGLVAIAAGGSVAAALAKSSSGLRAATRGFVHRYGRHAQQVRGAISSQARRLDPRGD